MEFINYSGGAAGADSFWEDIGKEYGFTNHIHYYPARYPTLRGNTPLSTEQLEKAWPHILEANKVLNRRNIEKYKSILSRNYYQALQAEAVFAVGELYSNVNGVFYAKGGTAWACQIALQMGKKVYLFDQPTRQWYELGMSYAIPISTPTLTPKYAGIGTRKINEDGIQAIRDVYTKTSIQSNQVK